jgi:glycosyltransferase involved in cell wall biosynthesis
MINIYFFQWISDLGGADTRLKDLICCFSSSNKYKLFIVPNDSFRIQESYNIAFLKKHKVEILTWETLPHKAEGIAISFCNFRLFSESWRINRIKSMGLKFIWSNDMMWKEDAELSAISNKLIDATIFTSLKHYEDTGNSIIRNNTKTFIVPNYFFLENYPYLNRISINEFFTIGKHSRADPLKYSDNFPLFYSNLEISSPKYRVMGFSAEIVKLFSWYKFDPKIWTLLECNEETVISFLQSLDVYVYNSHFKFTETQCRSTIEALLIGLPVLAPNKPNFKDQIWHLKSGFLCDYYEDYQKYIKMLESSKDLRIEIGLRARQLTKDEWCDSEKHIDTWQKIFNYLI